MKYSFSRKSQNLVICLLHGWAHISKFISMYCKPYTWCLWQNPAPWVGFFPPFSVPSCIFYQKFEPDWSKIRFHMTFRSWLISKSTFQKSSTSIWVLLKTWFWEKSTSKPYKSYLSEYYQINSTEIWKRMEFGVKFCYRNLSGVDNGCHRCSRVLTIAVQQ